MTETIGWLSSAYCPKKRMAPVSVSCDSQSRNTQDENGLYKKYTMQTLLDDLDINELYQQPGKAHHLSEITKKQMALYDARGVGIQK